MRHRNAAAVLILAGVVHNNAYKWASVEMAGHVWSMTGGAFALVLLTLIALAWRSWAMWLACALLGGFALEVAVCNGAYLLGPWAIDPQAVTCSEGWGLPLSGVGLWLTAVVARWYVGVNDG